MSDLQPENEIKANSEPDVFRVQQVMIYYVVIAVVFLATGFVMGYAFNASRSSSSVDAAQIEQIVRRALADAGVGEAKEDMTQMVNDDPYLGEADAPIVIVEFSAYACPYCGRHFQQTFAPLLENYGQYIRYVYRDFPSINPNVSFPAAMAANCANEQGKFWQYHDTLLNNQSLLAPAYFVQVAEELGMDMDSFNSCFDDQKYYEEVNTDFYDGMALGISGTPSFYINGKFYSGAQPYQFFERVIQRELNTLGIAF